MTNSFSFTLDFRNILRPQCAEFYEYSANFFAGLLAPVYFAVIVTITWAISVAIARWWHEIRIRWCVALSFFGACYSTFFVSIASLTLNLFACYPHPNGKSSLRSSPHVLCYEDDWSALVGFGSMGILVYCLGAVTAMIVAIWRAPKYYVYQTYRLATKFLFVRFRTGFAYWSVLLLLKGLAVSITSVMFSDAVSQFMWINFVLALYVPVTAALMPWRSLPVSLVDILTHMVLSYAFGLGGFFASASKTEQTSVSNWLVVCVVVVAVGLAAVAAHSLYLKYMQDYRVDQLRAKHEKMAGALASEMKRMVESPGILAYLFKVLPDWEVRNFNTMQRIILREANFTTSVSISIGEDPAVLRALSSKKLSQQSGDLDQGGGGGEERAKKDVPPTTEESILYREQDWAARGAIASPMPQGGSEATTLETKTIFI